MEDYEFGDEGTSTKSKQSKLSKRVTANRPLDPKVTVKPAPTQPTQTQSEVEAATTKATVETAQEAVANSGMVKFSKAFQGSFGGYTSDVVRALTKDKVNESLDPSWDVGTVRDEFRNKYGQELWDKFEGTRNRQEYLQYAKEADERMQREQDMAGSLGGSILGSMFDLPSLLAGGGIVKGAQLAVRASQAGKYTALTGGAVAEAGLFGGIEAGLQYDEAGKIYDKSSIAQTMAITGALHFGIGAATTSKSWYEAAKDAPVVRQEPFIGDIEGEAIRDTNSLIGTAQRELADYSQRVADDLGLASNRLEAKESRNLKAEAKQLEHSLKYEAGIYEETYKTLAKQAQAQGMSRKEAEALARKTLEDKRLTIESRLASVQQRLDIHQQATQATERLNRHRNGTDLDTIYGTGTHLEFVPPSKITPSGGATPNYNLPKPTRPKNVEDIPVQGQVVEAPTKSPMYVAHGTSLANKQSIMSSGKFEVNDANRYYDYSELGPDTMYFTSPNGWWLDKENAASGRAAVYQAKVLAEVSPDANLVTLNSAADAEAFAQSLGYPSWEKLPFFVDGMKDGVESTKRAREYFAPLKAKLEEKGIDGLVIPRDFKVDVGDAFTYPAPEQVAVFNLSKVKPVADDTPTGSAIADAGSAANVGRQDLQKDNIIESVGDGVTDWQDTLTRHADAVDARVGSKAYEWLNSKIGKASQFTSNTLRGFASSSRVVRATTAILGEDATGIFRAGTSGTAIDKARYNNTARGLLSPIHDEMQAWAKRKGHGGMLGWTSTRGEVEFNKLLRTEMEARWSTSDLAKAEQDVLDQARWANTDPEIKRAADAYDKANQFMRDLGEQHGLQGMAELAPISRGYVSRRMDGKVLQALHRTDSAKYRQVLKAVAQRYHETIVNKQKQLQALGEEVKLLELSKAETIIEGLFKRAIDRASGIDGSTLGIVDRAAREEIRTILQSKGMDYSDIEHTFKLIDKRLGHTSGSNRLKGRMDIDISTPVRLENGENFNLVDLYDNNLHKLAYSYSEEMSGRIALARRGIGNDNDFEQILNTVRNENKSLNVEEDIQLLRDMYSQMLGRPLQGQGENKAIQFLTQINPLQSLGQVGWAQATESSLAVARLGLGSALKMIPLAAKIITGARKGLLNDADKLLLKDIEAWNGPIGEFWRTHRPTTDVMERLNVQGDTAQVVDKLLKTGQQINGYLSFMHQIMEAQLKAVAITGTRKFAQELRAGKLTARLADAGVTEASLKAIKRNLETHSVWNGNELADLQLSKWDFDSADEFTRNIERVSAQLIQRDFVGETASWMHKDMGRLLLSLRGYSVKAFNKQLVRNVHIGDAIAAQSVAIGLAFSALGYTAKMHAMSALREDKEEFLEQRLSGDSLVMGAVGYMALGSIGPELIRPLMSWAGEGSNDAGNIRSGGSALVALIPGLAPIDRAATVVSDIGKATLGDGDYGARQVRSLTQFFLGNSYPVGIALNATLDDSE